MSRAITAPVLPVLPKFLTLPKNAPLAVIGGWALALAGSLLLATLASQLFPAAPPPDFAGMEGGVAIFLLVGFAPLFETLIMGTVLLVLARFVRPGTAALLSAIGWGVAHSMAAPTWGLVIWWPFLIFSTQFVTWRNRSLALAFLIPFFTHALQNLLPAITLAYPDLIPIEAL